MGAFDFIFFGVQHLQQEGANPHSHLYDLYWVCGRKIPFRIWIYFSHLHIVLKKSITSQFGHLRGGLAVSSVARLRRPHQHMYILSFRLFSRIRSYDGIKTFDNRHKIQESWGRHYQLVCILEPARRGPLCGLALLLRRSSFHTYFSGLTAIWVFCT